MLPPGAMNISDCLPSVVMVPVQSALTLYVPENRWLLTTFPFKLNEATPCCVPLPLNTCCPATAKGSCFFPSTPSKANRYLPCSVASEHLAPAAFLSLAFSSLANPVPTTRTPTPTSSTTPAAHSPLRFILCSPPLVSWPRESSPPLWGSFPPGILTEAPPWKFSGKLDRSKSQQLVTDSRHERSHLWQERAGEAITISVWRL